MDRSPWVNFIAKRRFTSHTVIAHVRYPSVSGRALENCHPFREEFGGRMHLFARNARRHLRNWDWPLMSGLVKFFLSYLIFRGRRRPVDRTPRSPTTVGAAGGQLPRCALIVCK